LAVTLHVRTRDPEIIMRHSAAEDKCGDCPSFSDRKCLVQEVVKLSEYKPGEKGTISQVCGQPDFRLRMMEMGFVKGTKIEVVKYAPLNDPMEFIIKGYHLTLRKAQAADILMSEPEKAA
jgi:ferrous iron transport protein A